MSSLDVDKIEELVFNNETGIFVVNFSQGGFVMVSADDAAKPVLAYSLENQFGSDNSSPAVKDLINSFQKEISYARDNNLSNDEFSSNWKSILNNDLENFQSTKAITAVEPRLQYLIEILDGSQYELFSILIIASLLPVASETAPPKFSSICQ